MNDLSNQNGDPWARIGAALERLERAGQPDLLRRTAADGADPSALSELETTVESLKAEKDALSARLAEREETIERLRREAARLAGQVDKALEQLALIEKG